MTRPLFNQETNRLNYGQLLQPDLDYHLDFAVGLTYSLDLEALLGVPVSLGLLDEMDSGNMANPFFLLEAIRKSSDKLAIFCNAGSIKMPQRIEPVYALLENSVFEVMLKKGANFHPKLWIIKYTSSEGISYIKVITLSRNLTFDRSFDIAAELTGKIGTENNNKNKPLADMLRYVAPYAKGDKQKQIRALAAELMKVIHFDINDQFEDYEFCPFGIPGHVNKAKGHLTDAAELLVISPFLSDGVIESLTKNTYVAKLITRKTSVTDKVLKRFKEVYITKEIVLDNELLEEADAKETTKRDIHAKIYYLNKHDGNYLYLGSLNASQNAFYHNVEFLLKLKFKPYHMSYDAICQDFLPEENNPFELMQVADTSDITEPESDGVDISDIVRALKSATATPIGERFEVSVCVDESELLEPAFIAPLYRPRAFVELKNETILSDLLLRDLSEFYIVNRGTVNAVVKLSTDGIPFDDRDNAIYKSIIKSKNAFLAYVTFILADNYSEASIEQSGYIEALLRGDIVAEATSIPSAVYERMLRAVVEQPAKLLDIENVMSKLDPTIVTDDFKTLFLAFREAAKKVMKK